VLHSHNNLGGFPCRLGDICNRQNKGYCARNRLLTESSDPVTASATGLRESGFHEKGRSGERCGLSMGSRG
jgi:hypothetical protein